MERFNPSEFGPKMKGRKQGAAHRDGGNHRDKQIGRAPCVAIKPPSPNPTLKLEANASSLLTQKYTGRVFLFLFFNFLFPC